VNIHWIHCVENFFTVQHFWTTCPEKQSFLWNFSLYWLYTFHHSGILRNLHLPWKTVYLEFTYWMHIFIIQDFWETCACAEKQSFPEIFHCFEIFFIIPEFWATCSCPENKVCPEIFYWIEIFFIIQEFWATCACPENRIFQPPATRLVRLCCRGWKYYILYCLENDNFKTAWIIPASAEWIVLVWLKN